MSEKQLHWHDKVDLGITLVLGRMSDLERVKDRLEKSVEWDDYELFCRAREELQKLRVTS